MIVVFQILDIKSNYLPGIVHSLTMNYTTSNLATYLEVVVGRKKYNHEDSDIPRTGIRFVVFDNGSMVYDRDPFIVYTLSRQFGHESHYFKLCHLRRSGIRTHRIESPRW
jgi:hypothetical protein